MTWHEDREITPGVPDLSYVMLGPGHETGWMELKATEDVGKPAKFKIEQSQHQWIQFHLGRVPIHFLIGWGPDCLFVHAKHHVRLSEPITLSQLSEISIARFPRNKMAENSFLFSVATTRMTNVSGV